jgi:hypothetical protein
MIQTDFLTVTKKAQITIETSLLRWFNGSESVGTSQVARPLHFGPPMCKCGAYVFIGLLIDATER